jgi:hypothetical protein
MLFKKLVLFALFFGFNAYAEKADDETIIASTLESTRPKLKLKELTLDEKRTLLDQANLVLSKIYVNKENKTKLYGFNPERDFEELRNNLESISTEDFHARMLEIFNSAKDYHVNYYLPAPHVCYSASLPIYLYLSKNNKYIVRKIFNEHLNLAPELGKLSLADEILKYDGQTVHQKVLEFSKNVNASTAPSRRRAAEVFTTWRDVSADPLPKNNKVVLQVKKANGEIVNVTLPWITEAYKECIEAPLKDKAENKKSSSVRSQLLKKGLSREEKLNRYLKSAEKRWDNVKDSFQLNFGRFHSFKEDFIDLSDVRKTDDEDIQWKIFNFEDKRVGYLKLSSFNTFDMDAVEAAKRVKIILEVDFNNTHALIIDLRSNLGGQIDYAEYLATLFHPNPQQTFPFMTRANEDVLSIYDGDLSWTRLIENSIGQNEYAGPGKISLASELSSFSQAYFGRVVLLTNAYCFSSCEIFAAAMKEFAGAEIYGLHKTTFGGGANVWDSLYFAPAFEKNNLPKAIPQSLSFRATVRHGILPSDKSIIDDVGVLSDHIVPLEISEIVNPSQSRVIYQIAKDLVSTKFLHKSSDYEVDAISDLSRVKGTNEILGNYRSKKIDVVEVYKANTFIGRFNKSKLGHFQIQFTDNSDTSKSDNFIYSLYGYKKTALGTKLKNRTSAVVNHK